MMRFQYRKARAIGLLAILLTVICVASHTFSESFKPSVGSGSHRPAKLSARDQTRHNLWVDLSITETKDLLDYLHNVPNNLNLSSSATPTRFENYVQRAELLRPNKSQVLSYLDGRSRNRPPRWATVLVYNGAGVNATLDEYAVGPLPPSAETAILPLTFYHNSGKSSSPNLVPDSLSDRDWPYSIAEGIADMTESILGSVINYGNRSSPDGLELFFRDAMVDGDGRTVRWGLFRRRGTKWEPMSLLSQDLYVKIDTTGRDPRNWKVLNWFYNNVLYNSTEAFRAAWMAPGFVITPPNLDGRWTHIDSRSSYSGQEKQGQKSEGSDTSHGSFVLDKKEKFVSWKGFEFYITFSSVTGLTLYDIRFQGEKILYELGLQEALSHYAGRDPYLGATKFLDTFWGMGQKMFELVPGFDCPDKAQYMDIHFLAQSRMNIHRNAICFFENQADYPLQRHTTESYVSVSKNIYFVVRTVSTVGNYDYTIEYIFYLDGSIEVKTRASGYIQGTYYVPGESEDYGYRAHDRLATNLHDHVLNFKADFDILGQQNTFVSVGIEPATVQYPWAPGKPRNTMKLTRRVVETETGLNWPANAGSHFVVSNNDSSNRWGEKRGYRIMPGTGLGAPSHLTFQGSPTLGRAAEWAQKDLWISRQKDTEARSSSPESVYITKDPMIDFGKFIDGESVVQEDLVIWFNLGNHHVPHSGDIPNTLQHTSASSIWFMPYNFLDRDPSRGQSESVLLPAPETHLESLNS